MIPAREQSRLEARSRRAPVARWVLLPLGPYVKVAEVAGLPLLISAAIALVWANVSFDSYRALRDYELVLSAGALRSSHTLQEWLNEALMPIFFFTVGMEIKNQVVQGDLSGARRAALPVIAAVGGMVLPACLYVAVTAAASGDLTGWGVPIATDVPFAIAVLTLLGDRVPGQVKTLILAFAAADDIGGVLVIAFFYADEIRWAWLAAAIAAYLAVAGLARLGVKNSGVYLVLGALTVAAVSAGGVHPTIAGVALGFLVRADRPHDRAHVRREVGAVASELAEAHGSHADGGEDAAPDERDSESSGRKHDQLMGRLDDVAHGSRSAVEHYSHQINPWVSYVVLPLFAIANAGIPIGVDSLRTAWSSPLAWGVAAGLTAGKPLGVVGAVWIAVKAGLVELPGTLRWSHMVGTGLIAGIGFTVSLFIAGLAFDRGSDKLLACKLGVLFASLVSGAAGYVALRIASGAAKEETEPDSAG